MKLDPASASGREARALALPPPGLSAAAAVAAAAGSVDVLAEEATAVDREGEFPLRSFAVLRRRGLLAAPVPEGRGGADLAAPRFRLQLLQALAHLGRGSLPVGRLYEGHVNALTLVRAFGTGEQRSHWFGKAVAGEVFAVWNTEAADGVRLHSQRDGSIRLAGAKTFASGAGFVDAAVITGRDDLGRWVMVLIDLKRCPPAIDRSFWAPLGMRASASFRVQFDGLAVGGDGVLGQPGDYYREPEFGAGAVRFAAVQQGGVEAVFDATRIFLRRLGRVDDPYQRARVGEMAMLAASGRQWLHAAAREAVGQRSAIGGEEVAADHAAAVAHAHLMRTAIEATALRMLQLAERSVGARGLMRGEPFERLHRDLTHYLRQAGPDAAIAAAGRHVLERDEPAHALWND